MSMSDSLSTPDNNLKIKHQTKSAEEIKAPKKIPELPPIPLYNSKNGEKEEPTPKFETSHQDPGSKPSPFNFSCLGDMGDILDMDLDGGMNEDEYLSVLITPKNTPKVNQKAQETPKATKEENKTEIGNEKDIFESEKIPEIKIEELKSTPDNKLAPVESENPPCVDLGEFLSSEFDVHQMDPIEFDSKKTKSQNFSMSEFTFSGSPSIQSLNNYQKDKILLKLLKERGSYKEKLRLAESEIVNKEYHIEKMRKDGNAFPIDINEQRLHLAFLFSSPLIRRTKASIENIIQLDYLTEIDDILKVCNRRKYEMKYKIDVATVSNFRSTITD